MSASIKKSKKKSSILCLFGIVLGIVIILAAAVFAAWWYLVVENIAESVTVEVGTQSIDAGAFLIRDWDIPAAFASAPNADDLNRPGDYPVRIRYCGRDYEATIRVRDTVAPDVVTRDITSVSVWPLEPEDFIREVLDCSPVSASFAEEPDMSIEGEQRVSLLLTDESGNVTCAQANLTVIIDRQAPVIEGVVSQTIYRGQVPDYLMGVTIMDDLDEVPVLTLDDSRVDLTQGGEYPVIYIGTDISGNVTEVEAVLTVIADDTAPRILGVNPISLYVGSTVSYRSGVLVIDDIDENPVLTIDSTGVDLSRPGTYEVIYTAADAAGNRSSITTAVTVKEKTYSYVAEESIYAMADHILSGIIREDMSDREKVEAVYNWITRNCYYNGSSDKTDWLQAAYTIMVRRTGDCFNFYAVNKLMLDRLGIPNITVLRCDNPYRSTSHYWSLVSVDGGETYYHVDTTPRSGGWNFCLVTDAYLDYYDENCVPGYYARDLQLYPVTPVQ